MSRTRRFLGGVGFGYANQFLITVMGLWLTPFLLGRIGQHNYGMWLVGTQVLTYLALLDFGVVALLPRETAYVAGRLGNTGDKAELAVLIGQTARLALWQTPLAALAAVVLWFSMPTTWEALRGPLGLVLLVFVLTFPLRIFHAALQGLQDLTFLAKAQMSAWLLSIALTVGLALAGMGLYAMAWGWIAAQVISLPLMVYRFRRRFPEAVPSRLHRLPWSAARIRLREGFWATVHQVTTVLLFGTDVLIVSHFLGAGAVVAYACTGKLILVLANQPQLLMQVAIPALSEMRMSADRERLAGVCIALSHAMLLVSGAVVCVVLATNQGFVQWWVGGNLYGGFALTVVILAGMLVRHLNLTIGYILFSLGHNRRLVITALFDGLLTVGVAVVLTRRLGLIGAPLGGIIGVCLISLPANLAALAQSGTVSVRGLLASLAGWFWRFGLLAVGCGIVAQNFVPVTFPALAGVGLVVGLVYAAVMSPVALRNPLGLYVRPYVAALGAKFLRPSRSGNVA